MSGAFAPAGDRILTASLDHTARLWCLDASGATCVATLPHPAAVIAAAFSPDGGELVTGGEDGVVRWFDRDARATREFRAHEEWIWSVAFSPSGDRVVTASRDCSARVFDRRGRRLATLPHEKTVASAAFSPDGSRIVTACTDGCARVFASDGSLELKLSGHAAMVWCAAFDASGEWVVTGSYDGTARVWPVTRAGLLGLAERLQSAR